MTSAVRQSASFTNKILQNGGTGFPDILNDIEHQREDRYVAMANKLSEIIGLLRIL